MVGVVTAGGAGEGVDLAAFSALIIAPFFGGAWFVLFIGSGYTDQKKRRVDKSIKIAKLSNKIRQNDFVNGLHRCRRCTMRSMGTLYRSDSINHVVIKIYLF